MGTHIDVLFARDATLSTDGFSTRLNDTFAQLRFDLDTLANAAPGFCSDDTWDLALVPQDGSEPPYLFAEGPNGFGIEVYAHAVVFSSPFRFWQLRSPDSSVATPLQNVVHGVVESLAGNLTFIAIAGGMGDSDSVIGHVYYENGDIDSAVNLLDRQLGSPCSCWDDLNADSNGWLFRDSRVR
ncbi:MAG: hypothetical protein AAF802_31205 [Planctomycetota bacterium]